MSLTLSVINYCKSVTMSVIGGQIPTLIVSNLFQGRKKQHKHKLFGPDFLRTFLTVTPGYPGVKKFLPTTGAAGKRTFWYGRPRFSARTSMTRRVVEKLRTKKVCVDFLATTISNLLLHQDHFPTATPPSLLISLLEPGGQKEKVLTKETRFSLLREGKS